MKQVDEIPQKAFNSSELNAVHNSHEFVRIGTSLICTCIACPLTVRMDLSHHPCSECGAPIFSIEHILCQECVGRRVSRNRRQHFSTYKQPLRFA